jgi:uncharacterized protein (DUF736 family)
MSNPNTECWEIVLAQNLDKEIENHPDFAGKVSMASILYKAGAWLRETKGGRPYISLQLKNETDATEQKINVSLWEKTNRESTEDPHFKTKETLHGKQYTFSAWLVAEGDFHELRIAVAPLSADAASLSEHALKSHQRNADFVKTAQMQLPARAASAPIATVPGLEFAGKERPRLGSRR